MAAHGAVFQPFQQMLERMAEDIFETKDDAAQWLRRPHPMLGGEIPLQLARTEAGAQRVHAILIAIKYGSAL
jgi:putative toxin-antitoxin system antitoxin component (TIGR02293 family)